MSFNVSDLYLYIFFCHREHPNCLSKYIAPFCHSNTNLLTWQMFLFAAEPSFVNYRQYLVNFTLLEIGTSEFLIQAESFKVTKPLFNIWIPPFTSSQLKNWGYFPDSKELQCWWQTSKDILQTVLPVLVKNKWLTTCCSWTFWTFAADLGSAVLESRTSQQEEERQDWQLPSSVFWE